MSETDFFDTNLLVYTISAEPLKAAIAQRLITAGGVVSVQVLNEFAAVATRKKELSLAEARLLLLRFRQLCTVVPLDITTHEDGLDLAERYRLPIYNSMIVAAALRAGCRTLYTEDLADGQIMDGLAIRNPFAEDR